MKKRYVYALVASCLNGDFYLSLNMTSKNTLIKNKLIKSKADNSSILHSMYEIYKRNRIWNIVQEKLHEIIKHKYLDTVAERELLMIFSHFTWFFFFFSVHRINVQVHTTGSTNILTATKHSLDILHNTWKHKQSNQKYHNHQHHKRKEEEQQ